MHRVAIVLLVAVGAAVLGPPAGAAPPGFPDLTAFTAVDPQPYLRRVKITSAGFTTPGLTCTWQVNGDPAYFPYGDIDCVGSVPGLSADAAARCDRVRLSDGVLVFARGLPDCTPPLLEYPRLPAGSALSVGGFSCAVGPADVDVACLIPTTNHGLVLRPSGSWSF